MYMKIYILHYWSMTLYQFSWLHSCSLLVGFQNSTKSLSFYCLDALHYVTLSCAILHRVKLISRQKNVLASKWPGKQRRRWQPTVTHEPKGYLSSLQIRTKCKGFTSFFSWYLQLLVRAISWLTVILVMFAKGWEWNWRQFSVPTLDPSDL